MNDRDNPESVKNIWKYEWRVRSRWIKFEQTVNTVTDKWGEPYVGPMLYQEFAYLKNNLQTGTVILNCKMTSFDGVIDEVLEDFTNRGQVCSFQMRLGLLECTQKSNYIWIAKRLMILN